MSNAEDIVHLLLPGRSAPATSAASTYQDISQFVKVEEKKAVVVGLSFRGADVETTAFDAQAGDVVELEYEGGLYRWLRVDQLRDDIQASAGSLSRGIDRGGRLLIPPDFGMPATRGLTDVLLKGLKILGIDPVGAAATLAVREVVSRFEDSLQPGPGLYRLSDPRTPDQQVCDRKELDNSAPYLLFFHGTASSVAGSFGGLAPSSDPGEEPISPDDWNALKLHYRGRILGLQHKTLSVSPVRNALDVARLLPEGAQLHLVSHSRGGLIGELLCLNKLPDGYREAFAQVPDDVDSAMRNEVAEIRREEVDRIDQLAGELSRKRFQVQRFVRVASPARGTVLASRRLDLYLSVFLNLLGLIPGLKTSPLYSMLKAVTLETARRRTDPRQMPGLEAMMPESPLIHLLNQSDLKTSADLAVIAGDLAPEGVWQRLKTLAVDLFYLQPNDLVVNTSAMYGGMERSATASYFFNRGPHVNHFHYFSNPGTRTLLRNWLEAEPGKKVDGFRTFMPSQTEFVADSRRATDSQPSAVVFVVPDLLGTQLIDERGQIWPSLSGLAKAGLDRLASSQANVKAGSLIPELYAPLVNRLNQQFLVEAVAYDWRNSLDDIQAVLRARVETVLDNKALENQPIHFVAHGAGGLAVLRLASDAPFWSLVAKRLGRVALLGVPVRSCAGMARLRERTSSFNRLLRMADHQSKTAPEKLFGDLSLVAALVSDSPAGTVGAIDPAFLPGFGVFTGKTDRTPCAGRDDGAALYTSAGDGLVTWEASYIDKVPSWQVDAPHAMLGRHEQLADSLAEFLAQGSTAKLSRAAAPSSITPRSYPAEPEPLFFPTETDLLDAALVGKPPSPFDVTERPISVSIAHGDLRRARFPLMVGHYRDDTIVSAEKTLDQQLGKRLTQRFNMGVYVGLVGTVEIVLVPGCSPPGALVVGLGDVGELTPEKLRRGVRAAALRYALNLNELRQANAARSISASFSAVLMGTYGQGGVRDSVSAVVLGAMDANRQLAEKRLDGEVRIDEIEIIELYQDIAIEAAHELVALADRLNGDAKGGALLAAAPRLQEREGGKVSRPSNPYAQGWWRRIKINQRPLQPGETERADGLEFTILTDKARAEDFVRGTQQQVLIPLVEQATLQPVWNKQISTVLFQLLIPRAMRDLSQDPVNMVLVVDEEAAKYPWELLGQQTTSGVEPLAVRCGLLRQLRTSSSESRLPNPTSRARAALIVGDTQSGWSELVEAQEEAKSIHALLKRDYDAGKEPLLRVDGMTLICNLLSAEYRIVHLAGHGKFDAKKPAKSGMKIGPDQWLTPDILDGMLAAPDLVFVNCCHLGTVKGTEPQEGMPSPHLAASFAVKLMNLGAKAVVAAGWAVNDRAARVFAERFYQCMLDGERFGDAVLRARQRAKDLYPEGNTWGAYQCYGNPDFRLDLGRTGQANKAAKDRSVARQEIRQRVEDIAAQADSLSDKQAALDQLAALRNDTPVDWRDGEMLAAFGNAYAQLGEFDEAITAYRQALADEAGKAPLRAAQQLANLLARRAKKASGATQAEMKKEALLWLEKVAPLTDTAELASIRGSYYKGDRDFPKALEAYKQAFSMRRKAQNDEQYYPGFNAAALAFLLNGDEAYWKQLIVDCTDAAIRAREHKGDIWSRAGVVDAKLLRNLWDGSLAEHQDLIADEYIQVIQGGAPQREMDSILGQIDFLIENLDSAHPAKKPLQYIAGRVRNQFAFGRAAAT